jgi:hypothetical protein
MSQIINRGLFCARIIIGVMLAGLGALTLSIGSYEMSGRDPFSTTALIWVTCCCVWLVVAVLEMPKDRHGRFLDEIAQWKPQNAV